MNSGPTPELVHLVGKRMVMVPEVEGDHSFDTMLIKQITGGDPISARTLYREPIVFTPQFKLVVLGNSKPKIPVADNAMWERTMLIPFNARFIGNKQDQGLEYKLDKELPGILNWCVQGSLAWHSDGLMPPQAVRESVNEYRAEFDTLQFWIDDRCELGAALKTSGSDLRESYSTWCSGNGERALDHKAFGMEMTKRFTKTRSSKGIFYVGIAPRPGKRKFL